METIKLKRVRPEAIVPTIASEGAAGADLHATRKEVLKPGEHKLIHTGWSVEMPERDMYIQIVPRSGLALKHGVTVLNSPGTIDSDYRGEIGVILVNHGQFAFTIQPGERIAQMIVGRSLTQAYPLEEVTELSETDRGEGGFGSTGVEAQPLVPGVSVLEAAAAVSATEGEGQPAVSSVTTSTADITSAATTDAPTPAPTDAPVDTVQQVGVSAANAAALSDAGIAIVSDPAPVTSTTDAQVSTNV